MSEQDYNQWDVSKNEGLPVAGGLDTSALPAVVDRATFQAELDRLRVREKAHTREGDAIAVARRRLPMIEVDPTTQLIGPHGPLTLLEAFEGRRQLIAYYFMWNPGRPASNQWRELCRQVVVSGKVPLSWKLLFFSKNYIVTTCSRSAARLSARNCNTLTCATFNPILTAVSFIERLSRKRQVRTSRYCSGKA